jgi:MFS family permease
MSNSTTTVPGRGLNYAITSPGLKAGLFVIEGLNSLSTVYFFYYVYFLMQERFGFGALQNFTLAAAQGLVYALVAIGSGRFAQRYGYLVAVRLGILAMIVSFALETQVTGLWTAVALMVVGNIGMCFTWPALEALVSDGESPARLQSLLGTYNVVWAVASAFAYFTGGAMIKHWGWNSMFLVPAGLQLVELVVVLWIEARVDHQPARVSSDTAAPSSHETPRSPVSPKTFLMMAWLANPVAYLAINTVVSTIPTLAKKWELTPMLAGFVCSVWLFVRAGAFVFLWLWPGWHYRFRFLLGAYMALVVCFTSMLLTSNLWVLILAQVFFGLAVGLIYYSSLFYSMDVGETKGEHGGIHEGAIGAGCFAGPAVAACGLRFFPDHPSSGAWAVTVLLLFGLGVLYWLRYAKASGGGREMGKEG